MISTRIWILRGERRGREKGGGGLITMRKTNPATSSDRACDLQIASGKKIFCCCCLRSWRRRKKNGRRAIILNSNSGAGAVLYRLVASAHPSPLCPPVRKVWLVAALLNFLLQSKVILLFFFSFLCVFLCFNLSLGRPQLETGIKRRAIASKRGQRFFSDCSSPAVKQQKWNDSSSKLTKIQFLQPINDFSYTPSPPLHR